LENVLQHDERKGEMPTVVSQMPKVERSGRTPKYNLDEFLSKKEPVELIQGSKAEVEKGKADYDCTTHTMRHNLYRIGRAKNLKINTVKIEKNGREGITFQVEGTRKPSKKS
jgi:hypothetical protein